ncbi:hypothetical protein POV27_09855 [Aureisphaera galaxeae]|uniref:hypothetical protein n=1 Tax=Aureisphaera galaxeae TaxID=1538023 RepID=UPI00235059A4|nr:hypothetical protein [Aureisphaera galaxeae]MDC8004356.1 hypothetical protein [Aureisphaera galaxeae]
MKYALLSLLALTVTFSYGQLDTNTNSVQFEVEDTDVNDPTGLELPARKRYGLTTPKDERDPKTDMSLGKTDPEPFDMSKTDGLLENNKGKAPKAFTKDKEPLPEYGQDQFLGDMKTGSAFVTIKYRDHEYVDGDLIRVYVNQDIVQSQVFLGGSFSGFVLNLEPGTNRIEFEALNQGSSGPNTAELHVYDDNGFIISAKEWNLLTGSRASIIVIKEEE